MNHGNQCLSVVKSALLSIGVVCLVTLGSSCGGGGGNGDSAPTVEITSPADGSNSSEETILVQGTASDDNQVNLVEVRVNVSIGGSWETATCTTSWSKSVPLIEGPNTIEARAQDNAPQYSQIDSVQVTYEMPQISGSVKTWDTQQGVPFITVLIQETSQRVRTDGNGGYSFTVQPNDSYTVVVSKKNYSSFGPDTQIVAVGTVDVGNVDFEVAAVPLGPGYGRIQGFVLDSSGVPVPGATVSANGQSDSTDANGEYAFDLIPNPYTLTPTLAGHSFSPPSRQETVILGQIVDVSDFVQN